MLQTVQVHHRFAHHTPRKVRLLADLVRGLTTDRALIQLELKPQTAAKTLAKLLRSGIAAADQANLPANRIVKLVTVDEGPKASRFIPQSRGRASRIVKQQSHINITIGVAEARQPKIQSKTKTKIGSK